MDVETITPIRRDTDAEKVALRTYDDLLHLLHTLRRGDWDRLTECAPWTVADMVGHLIGAAKSCASQRESMRQQAWGFRHRSEYDGNSLDAVNALQVRDHVGLTPGERVSELQRVCAPAVRGRMRFPRPLRRFEVPVASSGSTAHFASGLCVARGVLVRAAAILAAVALVGCSSTVEPKACTAIGLLPNGVQVTVTGLRSFDGVKAEVCTPAGCTSDVVQAVDGAGGANVANEGIKSTTPVSISVRVFDASGSNLVPPERMTVTPKREQPNGPDCDPIGYFASVAVTAAAR